MLARSHQPMFSRNPQRSKEKNCARREAGDFSGPIPDVPDLNRARAKSKPEKPKTLEKERTNFR
jgi:hypothetical protein